MRYVRLAAIVFVLTWQACSAFADTLTLKRSFVGLVPQDVRYNVNRDTKEVEVIENSALTRECCLMILRVSSTSWNQIWALRLRQSFTRGRVKRQSVFGRLWDY
jgi:hypothetical protein